MTTTSKIERNKANYLAAKEAFNKKDISKCLEYYSEDHEVKSAGGGKGRQVIQKFFESMLAAWGEIHISVEQVVAENDWVMARSIATATHPTNKKIEAAFWDLHLFNEDGLIIQTWNLLDQAAIMKQLN